jgi:hypothetical protein
LNILVIQNAIGGLENLLGKAKDALQQIEAEAYGYESKAGYVDAEAALGFNLDTLGHVLSVILEAAEMPGARASLRATWSGFKKRPRGLRATVMEPEFDSISSPAITYAERLIEGLRMSVIKDMTTEESWTLRRLEAILYDTDALVYGNGKRKAPQNEHDIQGVMHDYLGVCFPDFVLNPQVPGMIKNFKPDCGIRSVRAAIEFKFVHDRKQVATAFSGVVEDTAGYKGAREWTRFYAVYYQAQPFMKRSHVTEDMKRIGATEWKTIIVNGPTAKAARKASAKKAGGAKKRR